MFNKNFYPTPFSVIRKMLKPYQRDKQAYGAETFNLSELTILEPSAGKGDILDFMKKYGKNRHDTNNMYCCEIEGDLQAILKEKQYQLIGNDFLQFKGDYFFDLIIMNPPFDNGDKHLLHAWDVMHSGNVVCLLNSETINNPHTTSRKQLAKIINDFGSVEDLGTCFDTAARKTNVNVSLIRLKKESNNDAFKFEFEEKTKEGVPGFNEDNLTDQIAVRDIIQNILIQFEETKAAYINFLKARDRMNFYAKDLLGDYKNINTIASDAITGDNKESYNRFATVLRANVWKEILNKSNVSKYMTESVRRDFQEFISEQGLMDLTKENIFAVIQHIFDSRNVIAEKAVLEAFDIMTKYYSENRDIIEGWKTNDRWKINRKVILPYQFEFGKWNSTEDYRNYGNSFDMEYNSRVSLSDIELALDHITGNKLNGYSINEILRNKFNAIGKIKPGEQFDNKCTSTYFDITFYKKGTLHLYFKSEKLWNKFNYEACRALKWLPPNETDPWKAKKRKKETTPTNDHNHANDNHPVTLEDLAFAMTDTGQFEMFNSK